MIDKINFIKNFGIYRDFHWNEELPGFKKWNLIYGWNYSGKTTLSRIIQGLENGFHHPDYEAGVWSITIDNNVIHSGASIANSKVKVFNNDFIKRNLLWEENDVLPVFVVGEKNIQFEKELESEQSTLIRLTAEVDELDQERNTLNANLSKDSTAAASKIKSALKLLTFTKRTLDGIIKEIESSGKPYSEFVIEDDKYYQLYLQSQDSQK